ncbi:MAG: MlaD family protein [Elusimicrobiota bacterium]
MDFERRDFAVGVFVVAALLAFLAGLVFVNRGRITTKSYDVSLRLSDINGIDKGVEVMYRGYTAGFVDKIAIGYEPEVHFIVRLAVKEEIRLRTGTRVAVRNKGFGGAKYLEFVSPAGGGTGTVEKGSQLPVITDDDIMTKANEVLGNVQLFVKNLQQAGTAEQLQTTVHHAHSAIIHLDRTLTALNALIAENRASLSKSVAHTERATAGLDALLRDNSAAISATINNLNETMRHVPAIMIHVEELTADLKQNPWRLLRKGKPKETAPPLNHAHENGKGAAPAAADK